ncbi:MAG: hypothetical protein ACTSV6_00125 [Candidatus Heimdallarchaeota archaeon]
MFYQRNSTPIVPLKKLFPIKEFLPIFCVFLAVLKEKGEYFIRIKAKFPLENFFIGNQKNAWKKVQNFFLRHSKKTFSLQSNHGKSLEKKT